jgi:hypothetical protein
VETHKDKFQIQRPDGLGTFSKLKERNMKDIVSSKIKTLKNINITDIQISDDEEAFKVQPVKTLNIEYSNTINDNSMYFVESYHQVGEEIYLFQYMSQDAALHSFIKNNLFGYNEKYLKTSKIHLIH